MSYYATLGVTETSGPDEIKKAYRKLASKHHPDKGGDTKKFQEIQTAYDVLIDPDKRAQYDASLRGFNDDGLQFHWDNRQGMPDIDEIFSRFGFHQGRPDPFKGHGFSRPPRKNRDLKISINLTLEETLNNIGKTIAIQKNGKPETISINIPKGIEHGSTIKYPNMGDDLFESLPRGDLYVVVNILPHPVFRVVNTDLLVGVEITAVEAMIGVDAEVPGLEDKKFILKIPPGTQPGTRLRIKNQGLYSTNSQHRGNILVEVIVKVPAITDKEQIEILKGLETTK